MKNNCLTSLPSFPSFYNEILTAKFWQDRKRWTQIFSHSGVKLPYKYNVFSFQTSFAKFTLLWDTNLRSWLEEIIAVCVVFYIFIFTKKRGRLPFVRHLCQCHVTKNAEKTVTLTNSRSVFCGLRSKLTRYTLVPAYYRPTRLKLTDRVDVKNKSLFFVVQTLVHCRIVHCWCHLG